MPHDPDTSIGGAARAFPQTRHSLIAGLRSSEEGERERAADTLIALYWKPLYKYLRLRLGKSNEDAKDLVQGFFVHALEKNTLDRYDPAKGTFRTFIRTLFDRYAANERKAASRIKRGGAGQHLDFDQAEREIERQGGSEAAPDLYLYREWVRSLLSMAVDRLRKKCEEENRTAQFRVFEAYDLDPEPGVKVSYADLARRFDVPETKVTNDLAAMRRRFREIALEALREVTATEEEFRAEARALFGGSR
jgi:RNA polymerase sigma-70 factor (ECF subfamily)